jgi:hypothetical protein
MSERILIVGARAGQALHGETFSHPKSNDGDLPFITFYDKDPGISLRQDLPYLNEARRRGKVRLVHTMPREPFDAAVISTGSAYHSVATEDVLRAHKQPPLFMIEKPLAATPEELAHFKRLAQYIPPESFTNEPYLISRTTAMFRNYLHQQQAAGNPPTDVFAWLSKRRKLQLPHGVLGTFGVELPHIHGVAAHIAGVALGPENVEENTYFSDVDKIPGNDGNYLRFRVGGVALHVAQGLGAFTMNQYGRMKRNPSPPLVRKMAARFQDHTVVADLESVFTTTKSPDGYGVIEHFNQEGKPVEGSKSKIEDDPRHYLAKYVLERIRNPSLPLLRNVTLEDSLARSEALLALRSQVTIDHERILDS